MQMLKKKNKQEKAEAPIEEEDSISDDEFSEEESDDTQEVNQGDTSEETSEDKKEVTVKDVLDSHEDRLRMLEFRTGLRTY